MLLIMAMVRIEDIGKLADLVPQVGGLDFGIVEMCMFKLVAQMPTEWMHDLIFRTASSVGLVVSHCCLLWLQLRLCNGRQAKA